jgi:hypothetical protein
VQPSRELLEFGAILEARGLRPAPADDLVREGGIG